MHKWFDILGYEGFYQINKTGEIKSFYGKNERILKPSPLGRGYHSVFLCKDSKKREWLVHRLVALTFIPNPENKPCVNHKNGIRSDNRIENLEWCTAKENTYHSLNVLGNECVLKKKFGKESPRYGKGSFIPPRRVRCETFDIDFDSLTDAAKALGVTDSHISLVCKGKALSAHGLSFRYI